MVTMESDGYRHVLRMEDDDVYSFKRVGDGWEITFKAATYTTNTIPVADVQRDYIRREDVNNLTLYRRTPELIVQLKAWRESCEKVKNNYLSIKDSAHTLQHALRIQCYIGAISEIIDALESRKDIWETE